MAKMRFYIETRNGERFLLGIDPSVPPVDEAAIQEALEEAYNLGRKHQYEWDRSTAQSCMENNTPPHLLVSNEKGPD